MRTGTFTSPNEIVPLQIALGMWMERWSDRFRFGTKPLPIRCGRARSVAGMGTETVKAATPWGPATLLEELRLPQQAGEKRFASLVQLLEGAKGERLVRFAYATDGVARRGPVTLRLRDLEKLRAALAKHPGLEEALRLRDGV
jgi:hypothetical protein